MMKNYLILASVLTLLTFFFAATQLGESRKSEVELAKMREIQLEEKVEELEREIELIREEKEAVRRERENKMLVRIPAFQAKQDGKVYLVWEEREVPRTLRVLNAVYREMFTRPQNQEESETFYPVRPNEGLQFDSVRLENGVAKVYLVGGYRPAGDMSPYYLRRGVDAAAFQYPTVEVVEVFLNGEKWNWCDYSLADPEEDGCDLRSHYWTDTKVYYQEYLQQ